METFKKVLLESKANAHRYWKATFSGDIHDATLVEIELTPTDNGNAYDVFDSYSILYDVTGVGDGTIVFEEAATNRSFSFIGTQNIENGNSIVWDIGTPKEANYLRVASTTFGKDLKDIKISYSDDNINWIDSDIITLSTIVDDFFTLDGYIELTYTT